MGRRLVLLVLALTSAALARVDPGRLGCARRAATRPPRAASRLLARVKKAKASTTPDTDEVRSAQAEADGDNPFSLKGAVPAGADAGVVDGAPPRLFAVFGRDHDSLEDVRFALHNEHVEYLRSIKNGVYEAGYFLHPHLQSAAGTLYLIDAASADEARAVAAADPLSTAGLFSELHVHEWARLMEAALDNYLTSPPFLVYCADKAGGEALRQATRPAHLDWLRASAERISFVGPLLAEPAPAAGGASAPSAVGSLMLVCGPSLEEVQAWAATDPYKQAGLFERSTVLPFTSLDVVDRALPNCPAPPLAEWWTDEEKANAPPLLVPTAQIDETQGCFTEDGALRSAAQEIRDAEAEEDSAEVERWAEAMERSRLGTDGLTDNTPVVEFVGADDPELADLFWRDSDADSDMSDWPFVGEPEDDEALSAASARVPDEGADEGGARDGAGSLGRAAKRRPSGEGEDGLVLDGSAQDMSLQQMKGDLDV